MWTQNYTPLANSLGLSALAAAVPAILMIYLLGVRRMAAWKASVIGLGVAVVVALVVYRMPTGLVAGSFFCGAAYGLFPIGWIIFGAILLYHVAVESGKFEIIKDSLATVTDDRRVQALLIAFCLEAFLEGCAGFGAPVAVAATMLIGLGFSPFYAASICLLVNTVPVTFGSVGTPIMTSAAVTGLPINSIARAAALNIFPVSLFVPTYLIFVMGGWKALKGVLPAALLTSVVWASMQFMIAWNVGPHLASIGAALITMVALVVLLRFWQPKDHWVPAGEHMAHTTHQRHSASEVFWAWSPYIILVVMVLAWGMFKPLLNKVSFVFPWPGLDRMVMEIPPVVKAPTHYQAIFTFDWLGAAGTAAALSAVISAILLGLSPARFFKAFRGACKQVKLAELTIAAVLALAFVMNYSGQTATLGLIFATTGVMFPFFSAVLGGLGGFVTGSSTSSAALFGNLQVVTATRLGLNPILMAGANQGGAVITKMISLQNIAVAASSVGLKPTDEGGLFRWTLRHCILLVAMVGLITMFLAYVVPQWVPTLP
jgi:lactate permease